jgi:DNA-binding transcriptional LysR family regulator
VARGRLLLGASTTIGEYLLPAAMGRFQQHYPGVQLQLTIGNSDEIIRCLLRHELDLGFVGAPTDAPDLCLLPYRHDQIVLIVAPRHELAIRPVLTVADLRGYAWIAREPGSATRGYAERCLAAAGMALVPWMELGSNAAIKQAVAAGLGFGLISCHAIVAELAAGCLVSPPVEGWHCRRQLWLGYRRDRALGSAERAFVRLVAGERRPPGA